MSINVTRTIPIIPKNIIVQNWWKNLGDAKAPEYFIPVNDGGRLKIIPGKPNPHGVWLVVNNKVVINGNKIANRKKVISRGRVGREKTLFQAYQNKNSPSARNMLKNLTNLKMNQRVAVKQMIHEIIRERNAAMKNANWKVRAGLAPANPNGNAKHANTIKFWKWISSHINTGRLGSPRTLRTPRTTTTSPARSRTVARPPNAWNN